MCARCLSEGQDGTHEVMELERNAREAVDRRLYCLRLLLQMIMPRTRHSCEWVLESALSVGSQERERGERTRTEMRRRVR